MFFIIFINIPSLYLTFFDISFNELLSENDFNGHQRKTIVVDVDGTFCGKPFEGDYSKCKPIDEVCEKLMDNGVTINRPPRDGHMAFVRSPDGISIEILQEGESLPQQEPWKSMENSGSW